METSKGNKVLKATALLSWIGDMDLIIFYYALSTELQQQMILQLKEDQNKERFLDKARTINSKRDKSPIVTILNKYGGSIEELHLITNRLYGFLKSRQTFETFLKEKTSFSGSVFLYDCEKSIPRITDLSRVYTETQNVIEAIKCRCDELYCNLSSGVGVTTTLLIMLSSAYFEKYHLLQTYNSSITEDSLPEQFSSLVLKRSIKSNAEFKDVRIIGDSPAIKKVISEARRIAQFDYSVLILGPSGSGKSTIAKEIHNLGHRKNAKFEYVNCGSLTPSLLESKLYGHKKGAFTGADKDFDGVFKTADGGTVFLDEVADCSLEMQVSLLHTLAGSPESPTLRCFRPMGAQNDETSNVRIIAATNKNIKQLIREGKFREDLYYRLATTIIQMPPLISITEDIPRIAKDYMDKINIQNKAVAGFDAKSLAPDAIDALQHYNWTGNVRELQSVLLRAAIMTDGNIIYAQDLPFQYDTDAATISTPNEFSLKEILANIERKHISAAINATGGNKAKASRLLGMTKPQNLVSRMAILKMT